MSDQNGERVERSSIAAKEPTEASTLFPPSDISQNALQPVFPQDSAVTKAEKLDGDTTTEKNHNGTPKRKAELDASSDAQSVKRVKGVASIKPEFLIRTATSNPSNSTVENGDDRDPSLNRGERGQRTKAKGQNTHRHFGSSRDALQLCMSRANAPEFCPRECQFGDSCRYEHDLRKYLKLGKREDLKTFDGRCPAWDAHGKCAAGWRCRFASAHSRERNTDDGRQELVLTEDTQRIQSSNLANEDEESNFTGAVNIVSAQSKIDLRKRKIKTARADEYTEYLNKLSAESANGHKPAAPPTEDSKGIRAQYIEPPFRPSEKRKLYYGPETPVLAPLTTQGNLPFRRLCVELGAQITWSEMAMGLPLIQGEKSEWALMKAHETELLPPKYHPQSPIVTAYDNSKDLKFGAQIAGNKPWVVLKTTEVLTALCPHLRAVDLNCGCPIDLVYRQGAGSALLDSPAKLEKILRGMNAVSGEVPITVKIRMGTKDAKPTALPLVERLAFGGLETVDMGQDACGVAAITLHGRSRQQRYTKSADWQYISECAALIKDYNVDLATRTDTVREPDARSLSSEKLYFIGNGDVYSHVDYFSHIEEAKVDSAMVARGAMIKPWIFEEIAQGQYLDKSASERLQYIEKFCRYGLQVWGSDEVGVGVTRRFVLEWLSFACRYVPIGLLEYLPPHIQDRPPAFRGRDELETLMASDNYLDWIKLSEMFLGPAHENFRFEPKHKSNSYSLEAEG